MIIDGVNITADFDATPEELANYVEYVDARVDDPVERIFVTLCPDGNVNVNWITRGQKFERIRRITGKPD